MRSAEHSHLLYDLSLSLLFKVDVDQIPQVQYTSRKLANTYFTSHHLDAYIIISAAACIQNHEMRFVACKLRDRADEVFQIL